MERLNFMMLKMVISAVVWWFRDCPSHDEVFNWYGFSDMSCVTFCIWLTEYSGKYDYAAYLRDRPSVITLYGGNLVVEIYILFR